MTIYISTNIYAKTSFLNIFKLFKMVDNEFQIGIEIFPILKEGKIIEEITESIDELKKYAISFHGPYYNIEHSAPKGSLEYKKAINDCIEVFKLGKILRGKYFVFHHNNKVVNADVKEEMIYNSRLNLLELNEISKEYNISIYVENAGVNSIGNNLFTEKEFIEECLKIENYILIDIGHINANGWDLENIIKTLQNKIKAYHVHNNNGFDDNHDRILNGTLDFNNFKKLYKKYTPEADIVIEYGEVVSEDFNGVVQDIEFIKKNFDL
ncbi:MAG: sugar phosphate isomerase/epimerase [Miniphocaeibacter sp.]|uniref:sugar phosphate isomerase/epimerase family protein n=2 Tax=Miniphocaeibacter sp. TaxID=3100973 RepID=UPI0017E2B77E|nr:sugar phosphate isomerase/epimerase [Gallicola sp.]